MNAQSLRTIAIDDESVQLKAIGDVLASIPSIDFRAAFDNTEKAWEYLQQEPVDIVFCDIEMGESNGIEFAAQMRNMPALIVFVTAHTQYAVQAFDVCALDYIIKPISREAVENTLSNLQQRIEADQTIARRTQLDDLVSYYTRPDEIPKRLYVNSVKEIDIIQLSDIIYLTTSNRYTVICTGNKRYLSSKKLSVYAQVVLRHPDFLQIHRSSVVNRNYVSKIVSDKKQSLLKLQMTNGDQIDISRLRKDEVLENLLR